MSQAETKINKNKNKKFRKRKWVKKEKYVSHKIQGAVCHNGNSQ